MSTHSDWAARGFGPALLPVIPPGATLSPASKVPPEYRGKVPGKQTRSGTWVGYGGWNGVEATPEDIAAWEASGAGVGIQAALFPAVDTDVRHQALADAIEALCIRVFGPAAVRYGRAPRRVMPYLAKTPMPKRRVEFELGGEQQAVEFLGAGQFYVLDGVHPGTGQPYSWPRGRPAVADLTEIGPDAVDAFFAELDLLLEMFGAVAVKRQASSNADREGIDQTAHRAPSAAVLAEAVAVLPNVGGYDDWITGMAAIASAALGLDGVEDDGRELAREWTGRWEGGGAGPALDFDAKWDVRPRPPYAIGWGWIEERARGAGWAGSARLDFEGVAAPVMEPGSRPKQPAENDTIQEAMFRDWRWVEAVERFGSIETGDVLKALQFSARLPGIGAPTSSTKSAAARFLADERRRMVKGLTYKPGAGREVDEDGLGLCFNRWRPSRLVPRAGVTDAGVAVWLDHVAMLVPDPEQRRELLDWMACVVQRQEIKINFAPVIGGAPGIGKDLMLSPVVRLLGTHNVETVGMGDLESANNDWCAAARLVIVNEAHSMTRKALAEKLKPHIAAPPFVIRINTKHVAQYQLPNRHCMLFFTNRRDAVAIEEGDRRYFVIWCSCPKQPRAYFLKRWGWLETGGYEAVAGWLMARDIARFDPFGEAPWTAAKAEMARDTMSDVEAAVDDGMEGGDWPDLVNPGDLAARLNRQEGVKGRGFTGKGLAVSLKQAGARQVHGGAMVRLPVACSTGTERVRLLSLRDHDKYAAMPAVALARHFVQGWAEKEGKEFLDAAPDLKTVTREDLL